MEIFDFQSKKNILLFFSFLLVLIPFSYSQAVTYSTIILNDSFNYKSETYASHSWTFVSGLPYNTPSKVDGYEIYMYGRNSTQIYGGSTTLNIRRPLPQNLSSSTSPYILRYQIYDNAPLSPSNSDRASVKLSRTVASADLVRIRAGEIYIGTGGNVQNCTYSTINRSVGTSYEMTLTWDLSTGLYSVYRNTDKICNDLSIGNTTAMAQIGAINVFVQSLAGESQVRGIDNITLGNGSIGQTDCSFPTIFCDDFNYAESLYSVNEWLVYLSGFVVDSTFAPIDEKLNLEQDYYVAPYHEIEPFPVDYPIAEGVSWTISGYSPVFSSQFELNITSCSSNQEVFRYIANDRYQNRIFDTRGICEPTGNNISLYYRDINDNNVLLLSNATEVNSGNKLYINAYFEQNDEMHFNSTVNQSFVRYTLGGKTNTSDFLDSDSVNWQNSQLFSDSDDNFIIDDYLIYVGTDPYTDTSFNNYEPFYDGTEDTTTTIGSGSGDLATNIGNIWEEFGIVSTVSKIIVALLLMLITAIVIFAWASSSHAHVPLGVYAFVEFILMLLLVFIGLLPVAIVIIVTIAGIGFSVFAISRNMQGGS